MIDRNLIPQVIELHTREKLSLRQIAKRLEISRGTVTAIIRNEHPHQQEKVAEVDNFSAPSGNFLRCRTCGRKVKMPCLGCHLEEMLKKTKMAERK